MHCTTINFILQLKMTFNRTNKGKRKGIWVLLPLTEAQSKQRGRHGRLAARGHGTPDARERSGRRGTERQRGDAGDASVRAGRSAAETWSGRTGGDGEHSGESRAAARGRDSRKRLPVR
jgi:hypothetical protein